MKTYNNFSRVERLINDPIFEKECILWLQNFFEGGQKFYEQNALICNEKIFVYRIQEIADVVAFQYKLNASEGEVRFNVKFYAKKISFYGRALVKGAD